MSEVFNEQRVVFAQTVRDRRVWCFWLCLLLAAISHRDLRSPGNSQTVWRQTQTAGLCEQFADGGFRLDSLRMPTGGPEGVPAVYEFPLLNGIAGVLSWFTEPRILSGKLVAFACACVSLVLLFGLVDRMQGRIAAIGAALYFITSPVSVLMNTSYQADALVLALVLGAFAVGCAWRTSGSLVQFAGMVVLFSAAGLVKLPMLLPFFPLACALVLFRGTRWRTPSWGEAAVVATCFVLPVGGWYASRMAQADSMAFGSEQLTSMYLLGDLGRFLSPSFYIKPAITFTWLLFGVLAAPLVLVGMRRKPQPAIFALGGALLYAVAVPTSTDQYYYHYALVPLFAPAVGLGLVEVWGSAGRFRTAWALALTSAYLAACFAGWAYVLRRDEVLVRAGAVYANAVARNELAVFSSNHDRVIGRGGHNPAFFYYAAARGWNSSAEDEDFLEDVARRGQDGAQYLVFTYFTPDLELPWGELLPAQFRNDPGPRSQAAREVLDARFPLVAVAPNVRIYRLEGVP